MIKRLNIGDVRFTLTMAHISKVTGVNSSLPDGKHIIMWDFDGVAFAPLVMELIAVQGRFSLPKIYVLNSGDATSWIAYCFGGRDWIDALRVVVCTDYVDPNFIRFSAYRRHFTLRVTPKQGREIKLRFIIPSDVKENCTMRELKSWVKYETVKKDYTKRNEGNQNG